MGLERVKLMHPFKFLLFYISRSYHLQNSELVVSVEAIRICDAVVKMEVQSKRVEITICVKICRFVCCDFF